MAKKYKMQRLARFSLFPSGAIKKVTRKRSVHTSTGISRVGHDHTYKRYKVVRVRKHVVRRGR